MAKETKPKTERRFRALVPLRHAMFNCLIEPGEDVNMLAKHPDGTPYRYPDEIQARIDDGHMVVYFAPVGTPHVVHSLGIREYQDAETGEWKREPQWTEAAQQWAGETTFIENFVSNETVETETVKE